MVCCREVMESVSSGDERPRRRLSMQQRMHVLAEERQARFEVMDVAREEGWEVINLDEPKLRTSFEPPERDAATVPALCSLDRRVTRRRIFLHFITYSMVEDMIEDAKENAPQVSQACRVVDFSLFMLLVHPTLFLGVVSEETR